MNNGSDLPSRVLRLEEFVEVLTNDRIELRQDLKQLLTAQVVMQDNMNKLAQAQRATEERLNALIGVVDGLVRAKPPEQSR